jgi:3-methyladenine DNA glycosylase/8-oxoguanine DNA glycosylase
MIRDETARTWQLVMTGDGLHRVTPQAQADMARLFDLDPSVSHLTVEVGDDRIHVARDWPSDRMEEAERLIDRIVASGVSAIVVHARNGEPSRRVASGE